MSLARVAEGTYFATRSLIESFPCCSSSNAALQVNCFVTDPMPNIVVGVTGSFGSSERYP